MPKPLLVSNLVSFDGKRVRNFGPSEVSLSSRGTIELIRSIRKSSRKFSSGWLRLLTPGLVDPHTHLIFAGDRSSEWVRKLKGDSYQSIAKSGGGILKTVKATRAATHEELVATGLRRLNQVLCGGTTTIEIKSGYGLNLESELKILQVIDQLREVQPVDIISTFMGAHALPPEFQDCSLYIDFLITKVLPRIAPLAQFQDIFCEKGYFGVRDSIKLLKAGIRWGLKPKVHAHEFGRTGGVKVAHEVKAVSADHLMFLNDSDIKALKKAGTVPVLLPATSFFLGAENFADARKLLKQRLPFAIGSDFNPGTNPSLNFVLAGSMACVFYWLLPEEVFAAQTYYSSRALGLKDRGMIKVGLRADLVEWDVDRLEEIYYRYGESRVSSVFSRGKKVV